MRPYHRDPPMQSNARVLLRVTGREKKKQIAGKKSVITCLSYRTHPACGPVGGPISRGYRERTHQVGQDERRKKRHAVTVSLFFSLPIPISWGQVSSLQETR